jgi:catechol 2,3-dioxygenase-like lactoylglutathione lyase family enzyme
MQLGFVVPDLEAAIRHWHRRMGLGPFFVLSHVQFAELYYRGEPADVDMNVALAQWGEVQVEVIQQFNAAPSIYSDFAGRARGGLQHVGVMTDSLDEHLARLRPLGIEPVQWGSTGNGIRFAYVDTDEVPGSMVELIESGPAINEFFALVRRAAQEWDGRDPVRRL